MNETDESPEEAFFRKSVLFVLVGNVITGLTVRFRAVKQLAEKFDVLWKYLTLSESTLKEKTLSLAQQYADELDSEEFTQEL